MTWIARAVSWLAQGGRWLVGVLAVAVSIFAPLYWYERHKRQRLTADLAAERLRGQLLVEAALAEREARDAELAAAEQLESDLRDVHSIAGEAREEIATEQARIDGTPDGAVADLWDETYGDDDDPPSR